MSKETYQAQHDSRVVPVLFRDLGKMDYKECWDLQEKYFAETVQVIKTGLRNCTVPVFITSVINTLAH